MSSPSLFSYLLVSYQRRPRNQGKNAGYDVDDDDDDDDEETCTSTFFFGFPLPFLRIDWTMSSMSLGFILLRLSGAMMTFRWMRSFFLVSLMSLDSNLSID